MKRFHAGTPRHVRARETREQTAAKTVTITEAQLIELQQEIENMQSNGRALLVCDHVDTRLQEWRDTATAPALIQSDADSID